MKVSTTSVALCIGLIFASGANAALIASANGQTVYDTDLNITWLSNANLAATNTFGVSGIQANGSMTWDTAQSLITAMNAANYLGYNDWRLPSTTDTGTPGCNYSTNGTDCGYNSIGSEMAHLYYNELGNKGFYNTLGVVQAGYGLVNTGPFTNFKSDAYWSGTEYAPNPTAGVWGFGTGGTGSGLQYNFGKS